MDELDINIISAETTYINDSENAKSENNIIDSENYLNTSNNNIDSENKLNNKLNNKKLENKISSDINMSKARLRNLQNLHTIASTIKEDGIKTKLKIFYNYMKIKNITTHNC